MEILLVSGTDTKFFSTFSTWALISFHEIVFRLSLAKWKVVSVWWRTSKSSWEKDSAACRKKNLFHKSFVRKFLSTQAVCVSSFNNSGLTNSVFSRVFVKIRAKIDSLGDLTQRFRKLKGTDHWRRVERGAERPRSHIERKRRKNTRDDKDEGTLCRYSYSPPPTTTSIRRKRASIKEKKLSLKLPGARRGQTRTGSVLG